MDMGGSYRYKSNGVLRLAGRVDDNKTDTHRSYYRTSNGVISSRIFTCLVDTKNAM